MTSPPTSPSRNLQGASRTTGGFSRGRAMGNALNHADASDIQMDLDLALSIPAKIYLYESFTDSSQVDPAKVKPHRIIKTDVSNTFAPVLTKLARKYSPVRSMLFILFLLDFLKSGIESNMRIHTYEENDWNIKGKYETALEDDEEVTWMKIDRNYVLPIWLVSDSPIFS
jgi:hypothetical protein